MAERERPDKPEWSSPRGAAGRSERPRPSTRAELEAAALEGRQVAGELDDETALSLLRGGELTLVGRLLGASNATFYGLLREDCPDPDTALVASCVYKPIRGERPLADFPDGTLAYREVSAYEVSVASGWNVVPPTVLRDGPLGMGMVQLWVEIDREVDVLELVSRGDTGLRRIAVFDAATNNADRKGGHLLPLQGGHIQGVDHGLCFAIEPKLRTILWAWRGERLAPDELETLERIRVALGGELGATLRRLLSPAELRVTTRRVEGLLAHGRFPLPDRNRPVIPWPPF